MSVVRILSQLVASASIQQYVHYAIQPSTSILLSNALRAHWVSLTVLAASIRHIVVPAQLDIILRAESVLAVLLFQAASCA